MWEGAKRCPENLGDYTTPCLRVKVNGGGLGWAQRAHPLSIAKHGKVSWRGCLRGQEDFATKRGVETSRRAKKRNRLQPSPRGDFRLCGGLLDVGEALCCNEG